MKEFILIFRADIKNPPVGTPEERQAITQKWMDWLQSIESENKLVARGNRLESGGRVVKADLTTDGPFVEIKEMVGGYSIIKASSIEEAEVLAKGCPGLAFGASVEIREISVM
jgi:hypothetical protein